MSEHAWVQENLESHVAGGLEAAERERLEQHVAVCADCTQRLGELRQFDHELDWLFTVVRPRVDLEDRMVQSLRTAPAPRRLRVPLFLKVASAAAAVVMVGAVGAVLSGMVANEEMARLYRASQASLKTFSEETPDEFLRQWFYDGPSSSETTYGYQKSHARVQNNLKSITLNVNGAIVNEPANSRAAWETGTPPPLVQGKSKYDIYAMGDEGRSSVDQIAGEMRERSLGRINAIHDPGSYAGWVESTKGRRLVDGLFSLRSDLRTDEVGHDPKVTLSLDDRKWRKPDAPTNYNVDRISGASVPGPVNPNEKTGIVNAPTSPASTVPPSSGVVLSTGAPVVKTPTRPGTSRPSFSDTRDSYLRPGTVSSTPVAPTPPSKPGDGEKRAAEVYDKSISKGATDLERKREMERVQQEMDRVVKDFEPEAKKPPSKPTKDPEPKIVTGVFQPPKPDNQAPDKPAKPEPAPAQARKIIRSGDMEFEVDGFDAAVDKVTKIATEEQGFIATVNSEKLPNGKVQGSIVVRVAPERLDTLILKLRALGELKSQKIGSQDITKAYTDLESRLRAARTMEERLLAIIKSGKGEIKDLLLAEKELGEWRTRIETIEGEVRYYNNLVSLSTLTVTLTEKEIRAAFGLTETERVQLGIEVEDVEKAQREALAAVAEAKGRVTRSELKQFEANRLQALMQFEAAPESAGALRDRLKQLGSVARLDIDRSTKSEGGSGRPQDAKVKRSDVQFELSLYNLAATSPRKTVHVDVACADTEAAYKAILDRVKTPGRVVTSNLDRQRGDLGSGTITLEVRDSDADAMLAAIKDAGEVMRLQETENPDAQGVTRSKRGFVVKLVALGGVNPRETADIKLLARSVPDGFKLLKDAVAKAKGQVLNARLDEQDRRNITARVELTIRRDEEAGLNAALASAGDIYSRTVSRAQDAENVSDSKIRLNIDLLSVVPPRETITLLIETGDVDRTVEVLTGLAAESKGKTEEANVSHEVDGRVSASLVFTVPLSATPAFVEKIRGAGTIRGQKNSRNPQVADNELASARIDVILSNAPLIVPRDDGLWPQIRRGLSTSFIALSWSLFVVIVGLSFVLPWAAILYGVYRLWVRMRAPSAGTT